MLAGWVCHRPTPVAGNRTPPRGGDVVRAARCSVIPDLVSVWWEEDHAVKPGDDLTTAVIPRPPVKPGDDTNTTVMPRLDRGISLSRTKMVHPGDQGSNGPNHRINK